MIFWCSHKSCMKYSNFARILRLPQKSVLKMLFFFYYIGTAIPKTTAVWRDASTFVISTSKYGKMCFFEVTSQKKHKWIKMITIDTMTINF